MWKFTNTGFTAGTVVLPGSAKIDMDAYAQSTICPKVEDHV
jgi:hypothetical protein